MLGGRLLGLHFMRLASGVFQFLGLVQATRIVWVRGATMWEGDQGNMVVSQNRGSDFDSKVLQSLLPTADFPSGREIE